MGTQWELSGNSPGFASSFGGVEVALTADAADAADAAAGEGSGSEADELLEDAVWGLNVFNIVVVVVFPASLGSRVTRMMVGR